MRNIGEKRCDYCNKLIEISDFLVHIRFLSFRGIHNEYYHKNCFDKMKNQIYDHAKRIRG